MLQVEKKNKKKQKHYKKLFKGNFLSSKTNIEMKTFFGWKDVMKYFQHNRVLNWLTSAYEKCYKYEI